MLDKSVAFKEIFMRRPAGAAIEEMGLPEGFEFIPYEKGDETDWAEIEASVLEFDSKKEALGYFKERYMDDIRELERRCMFVKDKSGMKVATLTAWWDYSEQRRDPWLHWFAVKPEFQGKGIGGALLSRVMKLTVDMEGDVDVYLKTQTWSHRAIKLYLRQGFGFTDESKLGRWHNKGFDEALRIIGDMIRS